MIDNNTVPAQKTQERATRVNSGAPNGYPVHSPLVAPDVLLIVNIRLYIVMNRRKDRDLKAHRPLF